MSILYVVNKESGDVMNWTFGIITDGNQFDRVTKIIDSIHNQHIPDDKYEIIVVGGKDPNLKNVVHIPFNESAKPHPWITKKKMDIVRLAKSQNIALFHDYVMLAPEWYNNFCHFGEDWDMCVCRTEDIHGRRFRDFTTWDTTLPFSSGGIPHAKTVRWVDYNDLSQTRNQYISGTAFCAKKRFHIKISI
jgi:hypothetical protein